MSGAPIQHMDNLQYIHEQLCYAEDQRDQATDMDAMITWDNRISVLQSAYMDEASKHVSKDARDSVPQVMTINYV